MDDVKTFLSTTFKRFYEQHKDVSMVQVTTLIWKTFFDVLNVFFSVDKRRRQQTQMTLRRFCWRRWDVFVNSKIATFCYDVSWRHKDTFVDGKVKVCMSDNEAFILKTLWRLTTLISTTQWSLTKWDASIDVTSFLVVVTIQFSPWPGVNVIKSFISSYLTPGRNKQPHDTQHYDIQYNNI